MTVADGDQYADRFRVAAVTNENGNYRFVQSPVLDHNIRMLQTPVDPEKYVNDVADNIKKLSDEIVGRETDDMKKAYLLYKWVSENVYSDTSTSATTNAATAMATRRGTSSGYTSLLIDLCRAQGIPAMRVGIFRSDKNATGVMSESDANTTTPNYNCVEAYIESEDRWIIMDPTAASKNKMISGAKTDYPIEDYYFDISLYTFSLNSKIIERPRSW
jgi:transglutaminase-like putative cysteine protease